MKKLVDANVILRYLLRDDEALFKKASLLFEKVKLGEERVIIPESILAECVCVLLKIYKVERQIIAENLKGLFLYKGVVNPDKKDLIDSLTLYEKTNFSIVDCILCARSTNSKTQLFTFDDELKKITDTASSKR